MLKVRVLWFGRPTRSPFELQIQDYKKRVSRRWAADDCPLRPGTRSTTADRKRVLHQEATVVFNNKPESWALIALDETGATRTSKKFASLLGRYEEGPHPGVVFVIGSDLGLDRSVREHANDVLSLSPMTLPHLLARLVLWEQLFRATDILGPGNYHRS